MLAWSCLELLHIGLVVLSVCGCVPFLRQLLSIYIELHDCDLASNLICFLFYSLSAHCAFQHSHVLLVRKEALCCRTPHHAGHTMAQQVENPTKSKFICFDQMQWFDYLSCCRHIFVLVRDCDLFYGWFGKSKQIKPELNCEAKCELSFPWNGEVIFFPLFYFKNHLVSQCHFLFTQNNTQTSDTKHFPLPSAPPFPAFSSPVIFHSLPASPSCLVGLGHGNSSSTAVQSASREVCAHSYLFFHQNTC